MDIYSAKKKANVLGNVVDIIQMQSEVGAIAAVHGALQTGVLSSTFTSSQGLLLMLPNLYKLRGEMLPSVIYVASRSIASRSLSIFCDHQDIYATRITGVPIVSAASVQEILDLAPAIHASSLQASSPFIFFFDGFRTGHETQKVEEYTQEMYNQFLNNDDLTKFRNRTMTPMDPDTRGTSEDESSFFQSIESQNFQNQLIIDSVKEQFKKVEKLTGRHYAPFVYNGAKNPKYVMIIMGSATEIAEETINNLNEKNDEYGVIKVHLYRPFSVKDFVNVLPKSVQKIVVLDRAKEWGANGEPLYLDTVATINENKDQFKKLDLIIGGRYGKNGIFLLNTQRTSQEIVEILPNRMKKQLADKNAKFYIIDAMKLSKEAGLGERMNTVIQMAFLYLISDEKKFNESKQTLKDIVEKTYGKKGQDIVEANFKAMDLVSKENLLEINVDPH
uniref:Pyruvate flavodoxin/ferredoxin oxidoreductase pyrimidine binding domain-containing protein n=1 Tax=Biomphalaria glabrata TaxID=6526 RepID=A0A2C9KDX5_BIOGL